MSYWRNGSSSGMPLGSAPEAMYMVTSGKHFGSQCGFDYGNSETFDPRGRRVAAIASGPVSAGGHEAAWNPARTPPGLYFARLAVDGRAAWTGKIVLAK